MIKYHGLPITPATAATQVISGGHSFVSFANPEQLSLAMELAESFAVDCSAWIYYTRGTPKSDWAEYYAWIGCIKDHPSFDFAIIPDVIDGTEEENDALISEWPFGFVGVPVWHLNESLERLEQLVVKWPRIALGSSGQYGQIGTPQWWERMDEAMKVICDGDGVPKTKIHGLRMLDVEVFTCFPFSSADSTNIGRNVGIDSRWRSGAYLPIGKDARARVMRQRIEHFQSPGRYEFDKAKQGDLFAMTQSSLRA
jgi:hypothetical protein